MNSPIVKSVDLSMIKSFDKINISGKNGKYEEYNKQWALFIKSNHQC